MNSKDKSNTVLVHLRRDPLEPRIENDIINPKEPAKSVL